MLLCINYETFSLNKTLLSLNETQKKPDLFISCLDNSCPWGAFLSGPHNVEREKKSPLTIIDTKRIVDSGSLRLQLLYIFIYHYFLDKLSCLVYIFLAFLNLFSAAQSPGYNVRSKPQTHPRLTLHPHNTHDTFHIRRGIQQPHLLVVIPQPPLWHYYKEIRLPNGRPQFESHQKLF